GIDVGKKAPRQRLRVRTIVSGGSRGGEKTAQDTPEFIVVQGQAKTAPGAGVAQRRGHQRERVGVHLFTRLARAGDEQVDEAQIGGVEQFLVPGAFQRGQDGRARSGRRGRRHAPPPCRANRLSVPSSFASRSG